MQDIYNHCLALRYLSSMFVWKMVSDSRTLISFTRRLSSWHYHPQRLPSVDCQPCSRLTWDPLVSKSVTRMSIDSLQERWASIRSYRFHWNCSRNHCFRGCRSCRLSVIDSHWSPSLFLLFCSLQKKMSFWVILWRQFYYEFQSFSKSRQVAISSCKRHLFWR